MIWIFFHILLPANTSRPALLLLEYCSSTYRKESFDNNKSVTLIFIVYLVRLLNRHHEYAK